MEAPAFSSIARANRREDLRAEAEHEECVPPTTVLVAPASDVRRHSGEGNTSGVQGGERNDRHPWSLHHSKVNDRSGKSAPADY
jgi:hypothetical protein